MFASSRRTSPKSTTHWTGALTTPGGGQTLDRTFTGTRVIDDHRLIIDVDYVDLTKIVHIAIVKEGAIVPVAASFQGFWRDLRHLLDLGAEGRGGPEYLFSHRAAAG